MYDRSAIQIVALFLLAVSVTIAYSAARDAKRKISPFLFALSGFVIVVLTAGFGFLLGFENSALALALSIGIVTSALHPAAATCFFVACLFLRPWEVLPQQAVLRIIPRFGAGIAILSWLFHSIRTRSFRIIWNRSCTYYLFFLSWLILCAAVSYQTDSLQFIIETFIPITGLAFLVLNTITSSSSLALLRRTLIISTAGIIAIAGYTTLRDYVQDPQFFRLHSIGLWGNANDIAALSVSMVPLSMNLLSAVFVGGILWSQSRGALAALGVLLLVYLCFCSKKRRILGLAALVLVGCALLTHSVIERQSVDLDTSTEARFNYLIAGLRMAKAHPIFGVGPNNYSKLYEEYTPNFSEWGVRTAHSSWVLALSETGLIGLTLFSLLYFHVLGRAWRMRKILPNYFLLMITYGVAMSFLSHTYLFLPYLIMALILAAARIHKKENSAARLGVVMAAALFASVGNASASDLTLFAGADKPIGSAMAAASAQPLILKGSRGEVLLFMIKTAAKGCFPFSLTFPNAASLKSAFYLLPYFTTHEPSFTGALVGRYLDPAVPIASPFCTKDENLWLLGEIAIDRASPPGNYEGKLSLGGADSTIKVVVWKMVIPERPTLPAYSEFTPWFALLGHY